jgi:hypothetical protein
MEPARDPRGVRFNSPQLPRKQTEKQTCISAITTKKRIAIHFNILKDAH